MTVRTLGDLLADHEPPFVRQPQVASEMIDPGEQILTRRKVPCICPEQATGACGRTTAYSNASRRVREQVRCDTCSKTWTRVNC